MTTQGDIRMPKVGEAWRHYKGGLYTIVGLCIDPGGKIGVAYTDFGWSLVQLPMLYVQDIGRFVSQVETIEGSAVNKSVMEPRFKFSHDAGEDKVCPYFNYERDRRNKAK